MSIKYFCDCCDAEIQRNYVSDRFCEETVIKNTRVKAEIMVTMGGTTNGGHLCKDCLYTLLDRFDSRPKAG